MNTEVQPITKDDGEYHYYMAQPPVDAIYLFYGVYFRRSLDMAKYPYTVSRMKKADAIKMEASYSYKRWGGTVMRYFPNFDHEYLDTVFNPAQGNRFWCYIIKPVELEETKPVIEKKSRKNKNSGE